MMYRKQVLLFAIALFCSLPAFAELMPDQNEKGKYGYLNDDGSVAIKYAYDDATAFVDGRAKVRKGNKWGYIDETGLEVIKIKYSEIGEWKNGVAKVAVGGKTEDGDLTGAKWGFIDKNGIDVIKPEYERIGRFEDGMALIEKGGKYGYMNDSYRIVIPCKYFSVGSFDANGHVWVNEGGSIDKNTGAVKDGKFGVFDRTGKAIVPVQYKLIGKYLTDKAIDEFNLSLCTADRYNASAFEDALRKEISVKYVKMYSGAYRQLYFGNVAYYEVVRAISNARNHKTYNLYRKVMGEPVRHTAFRGFSELMAKNYRFELCSKLPESESPYYWVSENDKGEKAGLYDFNGSLVLKPGEYQCVGKPSDSVVIVADDFGKKKTKINYINLRTGAKVFQIDQEVNLQNDKGNFYDMFYDYDNGFIELSIAGKCYLFDKNGQKVSDAYDIIGDFYEGKAIAGKDGKYGLIGLSGKVDVALDYEMLWMPWESDAPDGLITAKKNGLYGYINSSGIEVIPIKYRSVYHYSKGLCKVLDKGGWGLLDRNNKVVLDCKWEDVYYPESKDTRYVWVMDTDSLYYNFDREAGKIISKGYASVLNFNEQGVARVNAYDPDAPNNLGRLGYINIKDEVIVPFVFKRLKDVDEAYEKMLVDGKERLDETDAYRYGIYVGTDRNKYKLTDDIPSELWDY